MARKKNFLKEDIVFSSNKEMQELGFSNISLAWDGKNDTYVLFTTYRHVVIPSEEEQLTKGELEHEERKNIVVSDSDCDVDRIMIINSAIRIEFERQGIDKLTTGKFLSYFYEMWIQRKQQQLLMQEKGQPSQSEIEISEMGTTTPSTKTTIGEERIDPFTQLDPYIPDRDYAGFAIGIIKKTVKQEDSLVRQIFYTGISKDSTTPINLAVLAPTSEGKTHAVVESMKYFPKEDVWMIWFYDS